MKNQNKAFSLVELLLGLGIFSFIASGIYLTFANGVRLNQKSDQISKAYREIRWSLEKMSHDLENLRTYEFSASYPEMKPFTGEKDKIIFLLADSDGFKRVSYYLTTLNWGTVHKTLVARHSQMSSSITVDERQGVESYSLVRQEIPLIDALQAAASQENLQDFDLLAAGIVPDGLKFFFAYLEGSQDNRQIVWKDTWDKNYAPSGVRILISFPNPDKPGQSLTAERNVYIPTGYLGQAEE